MLNSNSGNPVSLHGAPGKVCLHTFNPHLLWAFSPSLVWGTAHGLEVNRCLESMIQQAWPLLASGCGVIGVKMCSNMGIETSCQLIWKCHFWERSTYPSPSNKWDKDCLDSNCFLWLWSQWECYLTRHLGIESCQYVFGTAVVIGKPVLLIKCLDWVLAPFPIPAPYSYTCWVRVPATHVVNLDGVLNSWSNPLL